ncbi:hypothetical protein B5X24_HaOG200961 [Helicoverpa armigera]|nr:hypothetical protein B5X24_HaOG200961 [Helicoverpa armigera]
MIVKRNNFIQNRQPSLWLYKFITILRCLLGNYREVSKWKPICYLFKLYCIFICSVIVVSFYLSHYSSNFTNYIVILEYVAIVFFHFVCGDNYIMSFFSDVKINDRIMGFEEIRLPNYVCYVGFAGLLLRSTVSIIRIPIVGNSLRYYSITSAILSTDINQLTVIVIFSIIQDRIKTVSTFIASNSVPVNITGRDEVAISMRNVKKSMLYYNNLLDSLQHINKQLQFLVTTFLTILKIFGNLVGFIPCN